ncbi:MAG TPA: hypothetical protein ENK26_12220, partial [Gammaproteobacteria bacterium]|nr:hypothetical protein [Gammaproteobacteria bacterium]
MRENRELGKALIHKGANRLFPFAHRLSLVAALLTTLTWIEDLPAQNRLLPGLNEKSFYKEVSRPPGIGPDRELEREGARIGDIHIDAANIFDTRKPEENTRLFRLGNRLHIKTRDDTIRQYLLFRSGDRYQGRLLAESERLLRQRQYLHDASIRPVRRHDGVVDIEVKTTDVWTLKPGISFGRSGGENTSGVEIEEINLLGTGSSINLSSRNGVDRSSLSFFYRNPTLAHSWWDLSFGYSDNSDGKSGAFTLQRPFYALDTRTAGGVSWREFDRRESRYDLGRIVDQFFVDEKSINLEYGWSPGFISGWTSRYRIGFKIDDNRFQAIDSGTTLLPPDRRLYYPYLSWERREGKYHKDHNRNQISRTEDIALGWRMNATIGYAAPVFGADRESVILASTLRHGNLFSENRSLTWRASASARHEHGHWANALLGGRLQYHHHQSARRTFYLSFGADAASRLDIDRQLLLGGDNGLRGYPLRYQSGKGRWLFTAEQRYFSHWYPFRLFNVGGAIFADLGKTWGKTDVPGVQLGLLRDIGFGLRLGNARSGLGSVIHLDLAFPLDGTDDIESV